MIGDHDGNEELLLVDSGAALNACPRDHATQFPLLQAGRRTSRAVVDARPISGQVEHPVPRRDLPGVGRRRPLERGRVDDHTRTVDDEVADDVEVAARGARVRLTRTARRHSTA